MEKIVVEGKSKLKGEVDISTAKNAVLPILAGALLANEDVLIKQAPMLEDVFTICNVISQLGFQVDLDKKNSNILIKGQNKISNMPNGDLVRKMRASFLIMGPMIAKYGSFRISEPGGCNIGLRPIDLHLKGLKSLGVEIGRDDNGYIIAKAKRLIGNRVYLDFPSVGATENIMMAATLAKGVTIIENAAEEPEIEDLANFLNSLGAKVHGYNVGKIIIEGVDELKGTTYIPIFDRIEAGTFMIAAAITGSTIKINGVNEEHCRPLIEKLKECGTEFVFSKENPNKVIVKGKNEVNSVDIKTLPYPGFPTDMQAQMMSLLSIASKNSMITETVFENRFMHVNELNRMGANIKVDGRTAFINGVKNLVGCHVKATDLRAGAALILAGLIAKGKTEIYDIYHIDRGYVKIEEKFKTLGTNIYREKV